MRAVAVVSLGLCCGFLAAGVSAWNSITHTSPDVSRDSGRFLGASSWTQAADVARDRKLPLLVLVTTAECEQAVRDPSTWSSPGIKPLLESFVPVHVHLDGPRADRELCAHLGVVAAPLLLVYAAQAESPTLVDALEPVTGSTFERHGLRAELRRAATETDSLRDLGEAARAHENDEELALTLAMRLEAAGNWAEAERRRQLALEHSDLAQGPLTRHARLRAAMWAEGEPPADRRTPLEEKLLREDDQTLLYLGWTRVASRIERLARAASAAPDGEHQGVPVERWERRLRETTRRAWMSCPDRLVPAFGALLLERFARRPKDLDSLDRAFMAAVTRSMDEAR